MECRRLLRTQAVRPGRARAADETLVSTSRSSVSKRTSVTPRLMTPLMRSVPAAVTTKPLIAGPRVAAGEPILGRRKDTDPYLLGGRSVGKAASHVQKDGAVSRGMPFPSTSVANEPAVTECRSLRLAHKRAAGRKRTKDPDVLVRSSSAQLVSSRSLLEARSVGSQAQKHYRERY